MSSAQFLHVSLFGRTAGRSAAHHETAVAMLNEAGRVPGAIGHLPFPAAAHVLHGVDPVAIVPQVQELGRLARDARGHQLRSDGKLLMAVVASYPVPRLEIVVEDTAYRLWRDRTLAWLLCQFGDRLLSVVEHVDEGYRHLHAFLLPELQPDGQLGWDIHPGRRAARKVLVGGGNKAESNHQYNAAMRRWQDSYHGQVGHPLGHARLTVGRDRRRRQEHLRIVQLEAENAGLMAKYSALKAEAWRLRSVVEALAEAEETDGVAPPVLSEIVLDLAPDAPPADYEERFDWSYDFAESTGHGDAPEWEALEDAAERLAEAQEPKDDEGDWKWEDIIEDSSEMPPGDDYEPEFEPEEPDFVSGGDD